MTSRSECQSQASQCRGFYPPCFLHKTINNAYTFSWLATALREAMFCAVHRPAKRSPPFTHKLKATCFQLQLISHYNIVDFQESRRKWGCYTIHPSSFHMGETCGPEWCNNPRTQNYVDTSWELNFNSKQIISTLLRRTGRYVPGDVEVHIQCFRMKGNVSGFAGMWEKQKAQRVRLKGNNP